MVQWTLKQQLNDKASKQWPRPPKCPPKPNSVRVIRGQIYVTHHNGITVYNDELKVMHTVSAGDMGWVYDVAEVPPDQLIVAATNGLYRVTNNGKMLQTISTGTFSSVQMYKERLYAARYKDHSICMYNPHHNWEERFWLSPACTCKKRWTTLVVTHDKLVTCCSGDHRLRMWTLQGEPCGTFGMEGSDIGMLKKPSICSVDDQGTILMADESNDRIQTVTMRGEWHALDLPTKSPRGAVFFNNKLFVVSWYYHTLSSYARS